jgi:hypothetical protein
VGRGSGVKAISSTDGKLTGSRTRAGTYVTRGGWLKSSCGNLCRRAAHDLSNGVTIEVVVNSYRAVRGRSILAAIFDEASFWRDENFASPDVEVYNAVASGLARVPGSMLMIISSVHKRSGLLYQKIKDSYGKDDPAILAVMGSTRQFNPSFDQSIIDKALEDDPERFGAEYLCK